MATVSDLALVLLAGLAISLSMQEAGAVKFEIVNDCGYTIWPAGLPGGGRELNPGQSWKLNVAAGTSGGRFWGRTNCSFGANDIGTCQTGDCGGRLRCQVSGDVPTTLAEYSLNTNGNADFYDVSLVKGFNLPLSFEPTNNTECSPTACKSNISAVCPAKLTVKGGCKSACDVFQTDQYCCTGAFVDNCSPTNYSMIFKNQCPQAYSYANDDSSSTLTCPSGTTDYRIVFCPKKDYAHKS